MAFRTQPVPAAGLHQAKALATSVKNYCASRSTQFAAPTTTRDVVLATCADLRNWRTQLAAVQTIPGIAIYAAQQENDGAYDVAAEFTAMLAAIDAVVSAIVSAFPVANQDGAVRERVLNADGSITLLTFTAAQLSTVKGLLDGVVASIS